MLMEKTGELERQETVYCCARVLNRSTDSARRLTRELAQYKLHQIPALESRTRLVERLPGANG
jgi:hypothetical protein